MDGIKNDEIKQKKLICCGIVFIINILNFSRGHATVTGTKIPWRTVTPNDTIYSGVLRRIGAVSVSDYFEK